MTESSDDKIDGLRVAFLDSQIANARLITRIESISATLTNLFKCGLDNELRRLKSLADQIGSCIPHPKNYNYDLQTIAKNQTELHAKFSLVEDKISIINNRLNQLTTLLDSLSAYEMYFLPIKQRLVKNKLKAPSMPITNLNLSIRLQNTLDLNGITNIGELDNFTDTQLLCMKGIGRRGLSEIKEVLKEHRL